MRNAVALLFACLALVTPSAVPAETLEDVVRDLEAAYSRMTDLRAEFTQTAFNKSLNQTIPAQGTVYLKKGGRLRWEYTEPTPQEIVSDGRKLWVYTPALNQVNVGVAPGALAGPAGSFLAGLGRLRAEFDVRFRILAQPKNEVRLETNEITVLAADDMKLKAVVDILQSRLHKRGVPLKALTYGKVEEAAGGTLRQKISLQQGIPIEKAREIVRLVKDTKLKVQAAIQEDHVRVSGKNRDDLQKVIALLKEKDLGIAIQFTNYRSV